jgi:hypothetical protein
MLRKCLSELQALYAEAIDILNDLLIGPSADIVRGLCALSNPTGLLCLALPGSESTCHLGIGRCRSEILLSLISRRQRIAS